MKKLFSLIILLQFMHLHAQTNYQLPPKPILDLADTKSPAQNAISKNNKYLASFERPLYKTLEELAEPELN